MTINKRSIDRLQVAAEAPSDEVHALARGIADELASREDVGRDVRALYDQFGLHVPPQQKDAILEAALAIALASAVDMPANDTSLGGVLSIQRMCTETGASFERVQRLQLVADQLASSLREALGD